MYVRHQQYNNIRTREIGHEHRENKTRAGVRVFKMTPVLIWTKFIGPRRQFIKGTSEKAGRTRFCSISSLVVNFSH